MKKVTIITQSKDADGAVTKLRSLGVVHVEHQEVPSGKEIAGIKESAHLVGETLNILSETKFLETKTVEVCKDPAVWQPMARHIMDLRKRLDHLEEYSRRLAGDIREWGEWGDFDPQTITKLKSKNLYVRLYRVPSKELKNFPPSVVVKSLSTNKGQTNCVLISQGEVEISFKELTPPKISLADMRARSAENSNSIKSIRTQIEQHICYRESFLRIEKDLLKELELHEAIRGMGRAGSLTYLAGYIPFDKAAILSERAKAEKLGLLISDPSEEDNIPTLIRNPRWVSIIEPVFKLMEIVPGYRELDISPLFLLFLSLFFGMIIGDAGYGLLYITLAAIIHKRLGTKLKDTRVFFLIYLFSASSVMWGVLTGTVFGQEWYLKAGIRPLLPVLNNTKFLQALCFFIGAFHLTLGQGWQAIRKLPSLTAIADMGWISVLWAAFFIARNLILGDPLPPVTKWLIITGVALVIFFTSPQKNILKSIGAGAGALALSIMNNFTDVVSYVRLFAVGLAGVAISDTVNALAASLGAGSPILMAFILFIGHTINIVLGPVSVMVHGVRLNVLEFSGHAGLSWSGRVYKPLKT